MADADVNNDARHEIGEDGNGTFVSDHQMLTPEYFRKWSARHATALGKAADDRRREMQEAAAYRASHIQDVVIREIMPLLKTGTPLQHAGDTVFSRLLPVGYNSGGDLERSLRAIGWLPRRGRAKDGEVA